MNKISLRILKPTNKENDVDIITRFTPEIGTLCSNHLRAGIIHILVNSPETMHSMKVEDLCYRLGTSQSVAIHHLEKLMDCRVIDVKKKQKYGRKEKRSIWGLDLRHPNWILECYKNIRVHFFSLKELEKITNVNQSFRR